MGKVIAFAIVLADSVGIPREVSDKAKRQIHAHTGLPADHVLTAATHTHSATSSGWRNALAPDKEFSDYQKFLARRISDGVRRAINNIEPARVGWGTADEPRQVTNRRRFAKPGMPMPNPFGGQDQVKGCSVQRELELVVRKPTAEQLLHAKEMLADPQRPDK
jgi:neutral ceramidase